MWRQAATGDKHAAAPPCLASPRPGGPGARSGGRDTAAGKLAREHKPGRTRSYDENLGFHHVPQSGNLAQIVSRRFELAAIDEELVKVLRQMKDWLARRGSDVRATRPAISGVIVGKFAYQIGMQLRSYAPFLLLVACKGGAAVTSADAGALAPVVDAAHAPPTAATSTTAAPATATPLGAEVTLATDGAPFDLHAEAMFPPIVMRRARTGSTAAPRRGPARRPSPSRHVPAVAK